MVRKLYSFLFLFVFVAALQVNAQAPPELLWYKFDEVGGTQTQNFAVPGVGTAMAPLMGGLTMGSTGEFGAALIGTGVSASTDYVNTGWTTNLGTSSWTISMWINSIPASTTLHYLFGDNTAASFRCFTNGVAGPNNIMIRGGGLTDLIIGPVIPGPSVVHFVYDATANTAYGYVNGVLGNTVAQVAPNITGTGTFKVNGYSSSAGLPAGGLMDEFRLYNRALSAAEVAATWNNPLPVELTSFTAVAFGNDVNLQWVTATEINNSGFSVERNNNGVFESIGFVPGFGTTSETKTYSFTDMDLQTGTYTYRLKQLDHNGAFEYSSVVEVEVVVPFEFALQQNYPNPFNPSTTINFSLALDAKVNMKVFNVLGEEVANLLNSDLSAGNHQVNFDASNLNSGIYFYRITASGIDGSEFTSVKKMTLTK